MFPDRIMQELAALGYCQRKEGPNCKHKWREVYGDELKELGFRRLFSHDHAYVCDECKRTKIVDSSD